MNLLGGCSWRLHGSSPPHHCHWSRPNTAHPGCSSTCRWTHRWTYPRVSCSSEPPRCTSWSHVCPVGPWSWLGCNKSIQQFHLFTSSVYHLPSACLLLLIKHGTGPKIAGNFQIHWMSQSPMESSQQWVVGTTINHKWDSCGPVSRWMDDGVKWSQGLWKQKNAVKASRENRDRMKDIQPKIGHRIMGPLDHP